MNLKCVTDHKTQQIMCMMTDSTNDDRRGRDNQAAATTATAPSSQQQRQQRRTHQPTASTVWGPQCVERVTQRQPQQQPNGLDKEAMITSNSNVSAPTSTAAESGNNPQRRFEVSLHTLPKPLQREFHHVFPVELFLDQHVTTPISTTNNASFADSNHHLSETNVEFLAICTNQQSAVDLVGIGDAVEYEKDLLLNRFMAVAQTVCTKLHQAGYWADYIDPCSGLPMLSSSSASTIKSFPNFQNSYPCLNKVYSEVDGMECCLGYRSYNAGCCKVLLHPVWGSHVYPATMFTRAPRAIVRDILEQL